MCGSEIQQKTFPHSHKDLARLFGLFAWIPYYQKHTIRRNDEDDDAADDDDEEPN